MDSPLRRGARLPLTLLALALAAWIVTGPSAFAKGGGGGGHGGGGGGGGHGGGGHSGGSGHSGGYHGGGTTAVVTTVGTTAATTIPSMEGASTAVITATDTAIRTPTHTTTTDMPIRITDTVIHKITCSKRPRRYMPRLHRGGISESMSRRSPTGMAAACKSSRFTPARQHSKPDFKWVT